MEFLWNSTLVALFFSSAILVGCAVGSLMHGIGNGKK